jgi:GNAT superfamily N-acetyltransferase
MSERSAIPLSRIRIRRMRPGEERRVSRLVKKVFLEFVAPGFSTRGRRHFLGFVRPSALRRLVAENHVIFVAERMGTEALLGVIDIRDGSHVSLFFVSGRHQRKGIGRVLLQKAVDRCGKKRRTLTVNASPNAVSAYRALGFRRLHPEPEKNGIRYVSMARRP